MAGERYGRETGRWGYTPEQFMADNDITRDEVEAEKRRLLDEIRLHEPKEARNRVGARPDITGSSMPSRADAPRPCR